MSEKSFYSSQYFHNACLHLGLPCPDPVSETRLSNCVHVGALITGLLSEGLGQTVISSGPNAGNHTWDQCSKRAIVPGFSSTPGLDGTRSPPASEAALRSFRKDKGLDLVRKRAACTLNSHSTSRSPGQFLGSQVPGQALTDSRGVTLASCQAEGGHGGSTQEGAAGSHSLHCYSHEEGKHLVLSFKGKKFSKEERSLTLLVAATDPPATCPLQAPSMTSATLLPGSVGLCNKS